MKTALILFLVVCLTSCTSMRTLPVPAPAGGAPDSIAGLKVGDTVRITVAGRQVHEGTVAEAAIGSITLVLADNQRRIVLDAKDIQSIERREVDALKTTLLTVVLIYGVAAAALSKAAFFPPP
ncbi:MAG: hypothetical protein JNJ55_13855 [Betaproteobacteria bacterium]|nr:hypothetical protein [Betaproteobacteria bacterium]